jgi:hypothetical protein
LLTVFCRHTSASLLIQENAAGSAYRRTGVRHLSPSEREVHAGARPSVLTGELVVSNTKGSSEESIGRPKEWREGRYQQPGKSVDKTVVTPPKTPVAPEHIESTPVTHLDYESLDKPAERE